MHISTQRSSQGGGGNPGFGGKPRIDLPNPTGPGVTTVQVPVPSNKCGLIIGKGKLVQV